MSVKRGLKRNIPEKIYRRKKELFKEKLCNFVQLHKILKITKCSKVA
jgi:hypothetical protein